MFRGTSFAIGGWNRTCRTDWHSLTGAGALTRQHRVSGDRVLLSSGRPAVMAVDPLPEGARIPRRRLVLVRDAMPRRPSRRLLALAPVYASKPPCRLSPLAPREAVGGSQLCCSIAPSPRGP